MKLTILGSGASEGVPVPFCRCRVCTGGEVRLRTSYHLEVSPGCQLLIDLGPDFRAQQLQHGFDFTHCFLSHDHFDHTGGLSDLRQAWIIGREYLLQKDPAFTLRLDPPKKFLVGRELHDLFYGMDWPESTGYAYRELIERGIFTPRILEPGRFQAVDGFEIRILYNLHGRAISNGFLLRSGGKVLAYLADLSTMDDLTRGLLHDNHPDLIIFHLPAFFASQWEDHIDIDSIVEFYTKYRVLISHFSHESGLTGADLQAEAVRRHPNLIVGYDGLEIDL